MGQLFYQFNETSPAAPGTAASSQPVTGSPGSAPAGVLLFGGPQLIQSLKVRADLVGAAGGTLDVYIQTSSDSGTTWDDYAHYTQLAASAAAVHYAFSVSRGGQLLVPVAVGVGLVPALGANVVVGGDWGDRMRLVMVAGASTTAGASVVVKVVASSSVAGSA